MIKALIRCCRHRCADHSKVMLRHAAGGQVLSLAVVTQVHPNFATNQLSAHNESAQGLGPRLRLRSKAVQVGKVHVQRLCVCISHKRMQLRNTCLFMECKHVRCGLTSAASTYILHAVWSGACFMDGVHSVPCQESQLAVPTRKSGKKPENNAASSSSRALKIMVCIFCGISSKDDSLFCMGFWVALR